MKLAYVSSPYLHRLTLLSSLLLAAPAILPACGAQSANSTDTGNPPLLDDQKIKVEADGDKVTVSGARGAVSAGAEVTVRNETTEQSKTVTADEDGSFEVELSGSVSDEYRVQAKLNGKTDSVQAGGSTSPSDDELDLDDRDFLLKKATGYTPVAATTIRVFFMKEDFGFSGGCNSHFGSYSVCDGKLCLKELGSTAKACEAELHTQDQWLANFFMDSPSISQAGDQLTFTGSDAELQFLDREVANPDRSLIGRTWVIDTFIDGGAASTVPLQGEPRIVFHEEGVVEVFTTCNTGGGNYERVGETIELTDIAYTEKGCNQMGSSAAEAHIIQVMRDGTLSVEIDANRLTLMHGDLGLSATTE